MKAIFFAIVEFCSSFKLHRYRDTVIKHPFNNARTATLTVIGVSMEIGGGEAVFSEGCCGVHSKAGIVCKQSAVLTGR
jgi:hypothetical protein